jgi:uncharacterized coiled-coil protein SlyX
MTLEERMQRMEAAYGTQSDLMRELREAVTVTAELEARQSRLQKEQSEWLVSHEKRLASHENWLASHEESMEKHDRAMEILDERIKDLVSGFGEYLRRQNAR